MNQTVTKYYETVIGLEVHLQLSTETKIFCGCANKFGEEPNSLTCPVCLGLPGSLPVLNKKSLEYGIKAGLAINCSINPLIKFDRKNYYYPDLPKAYQISQYDMPVASNGFLMITDEEGKQKRIRILRAHLEEDAGKLIHESACSLVDYNRTGTPLLEIVTEPDLRSPQEAYDYLQNLKLTLQYLDVSDCDMEKGSLRCDANISIREKGETKLGTKTELKNMNSFKAVKTALEYEISRHKSVIGSGDKIIQETRLWDESKQMSFSMRSKEEAHDYRYFPEPDLVPFIVSADRISEIKASIPELPFAKLERFIKEYTISEYDARIIIQDNAISDFFEECAKHYKDVKKICNWINGSLLQELNSRKSKLTEIDLGALELTKLIQKVDDEELSNLAAKDVLTFMIDSGKGADEIIKEKGLAQVSNDNDLEKIVEEVLAENKKVAAEIKEGKESAIGFLVGQAMKKTQGKANPKKVGEIIKNKLSND
ncbi:MAG: Asp-tRNA(Asn)/Glu-tRNA(Gln) amidotransferase subunit GatB [Candidatus Omnitrophica bacterium]|nr:Asp-tRNA(Asn)/Glu-tRNA(Gln) amidotransferase subunit GatB [Candidatus Omnitrophota bacterium]MBU1996333.1 Asp-tRNA(Asn)/Glu-tRNA(Gln) amidotransferase subunit GatB [Candidatus Omnitrophota bacterium]MBU4333738.1 Asp-tRNA(Asn)/Glu-tRNA(Gln) amidotransferase subunit GatB [Candidatus Omnitrophota bacterium]